MMKGIAASRERRDWSMERLSGYLGAGVSGRRRLGTRFDQKITHLKAPEAVGHGPGGPGPVGAIAPVFIQEVAAAAAVPDGVLQGGLGLAVVALEDGRVNRDGGQPFLPSRRDGRENELELRLNHHE